MVCLVGGYISVIIDNIMGMYGIDTFEDYRFSFTAIHEKYR